MAEVRYFGNWKLHVNAVNYWNNIYRQKKAVHNLSLMYTIMFATQGHVVGFCFSPLYVLADIKHDYSTPSTMHHSPLL